MPGIILICIVLFFAWISGVFSRVPNPQKIKGTIISTEYVPRSGKSAPTYYATVEYIVGHERYNVKTNYRSSSFREGDTLTVIYNKQNPAQAIIRPETSTYIVFSILFLCGVYIAIQSFLLN